MNTAEQAQQLRLAAEIIETGHPFEVAHETTLVWKHPWLKPHEHVTEGLIIRLALATPPDGRPLHNPDNLTAEQVGAGWRLLLPEELDGRHRYTKDGCQWWSKYFAGEEERGEGWAWTLEDSARTKNDSHRVPLSTPWPEVEKPDPYAELKAAHAEGKVIQQSGHGSGNWFDCGTHIEWTRPPECYRVKPEPDFTLPPPPPGKEWHRTDGWTEEMLPPGYRPLAEGERLKADTDSFRSEYIGFRIVKGLGGKLPMYPAKSFYRTTRPLTFTHLGHEWTWHRPGDPMPCDGERKVCLLRSDREEFCRVAVIGVAWDWSDLTIIGWRYADEPKKTVPLGPEDVPPGSVFRGNDWPATSYRCPFELTERGVAWNTQSLSEWNVLHGRFEINRSIPLTGKWNADAWEPCSKEVAP